MKYLPLVFACVGCPPNGSVIPPIPDPWTSAGSWTIGVVDVEHAQSAIGVLESVEATEENGFDRVVFTFSGDRPSYHIEYVDHPVYRCGSGDVAEIDGDGWLSVTFEAAAAHDDDGNPTVAVREWAANLPVLLELELTCDYEAQVTWVLGVGIPNRFRVDERSSPTRLVLDIEH